jgi:uncharacterized protein YhfF
MDQKPAIQKYWRAYVNSRSPEQSDDVAYSAWAFGNTPEMADRLGDLVIQGLKIATASLAWAYDVDEDPSPEIGDLSIILDGKGEPLCIIETTDVEILPFNRVTEKHAYEEGEGDRSLTYWREAHWTFFTEECKRINREPSAEMPIVCERFRVIYA